MNPPSPFIPKGSFLERQTAQRRSKLRMIVLCVLAFHLLLLGGWLIQGCKHRHAEVVNSESAQVNNAATINALRALNQLKSDQLIVGKTLKLPAFAASVENSRGPAVSATSSNLPAQP